MTRWGSAFALAAFSSLGKGQRYDHRGSGGMADTHASGACARNRVRVQIPSSP